MLFAPPGASSPEDTSTHKKAGFVSSIPGGFFLEFFVIAATTAFISWLCLLIEDRWPGTFPIATDYIYITAFGVVVQLNAYLALMGRYYTSLLDAVVDLSVHTGSQAVLSEAAKSIFNESHQLAELASKEQSSAVHRAVLRIENNVQLLDSPVLHRIAQFSVYFLAFVLPWALWFTFQWFTIAVVPLAMTPLLLARQYGSKMRGKARAANRNAKGWTQIQSTLSRASVLLNKS